MKARRMVLAGMMVLATAGMTTSCRKDAPKAVETRAFAGFEEIEINGSPTVYYAQADSFSVRVEGPKGKLGHILTEQEGKVLSIRNRGKIGMFNVSLGDEGKVRVYVTSPDLVAVRLNGSGDFICGQAIDTDKMQIVLRGSGDIAVNGLLCDQCRVELIGAGDIDVERLEAQEAEATLIGSGDIGLKLFKVMNTTLLLKGSGDMDVEFAEGCRAVTCGLSGTGDISLKGKIEHFSQQKYGSGDVDIANLTIEK